MTYFLFPTEEEALLAEAQIVHNVFVFASQNSPDRVSTTPLGLYGYNAKTGLLETNSGLTTKWAIPFECVEGWVFPVPPDIDPMTSEQMTAGISAEIISEITPIETDDGQPLLPVVEEFL